MAFDFTDAPLLRREWHTPCFDNLNKLDWPCGFAVTSFGVRIAVRANDPELLERLRSLLPPHAKPYHGKVVDHFLSAIRGGTDERTRVRRFHLLYGNHDLVMRGRTLDQMLEAFEPAFKLAVAALSPRRVFVHAGAVGWKGRAILLPGSSFSGKSTLVAALVRAGASYFSDDYAVLDSAGRVYPFGNPLSMRLDRTYRQTDMPVEEIGGKAATRSRPVGLVVMTKYKEGAGWRPRTMTPGRGALAIFSNTTTAWHAPERSMKAISEVVRQAPVVRSPRGAAEDVAPLLLRMLERRARC